MDTDSERWSIGTNRNCLDSNIETLEWSRLPHTCTDADCNVYTDIDTNVDSDVDSHIDCDRYSNSDTDSDALCEREYYLSKQRGIGCGPFGQS